MIVFKFKINHQQEKVSSMTKILLYQFDISLANGDHFHYNKCQVRQSHVLNFHHMLYPTFPNLIVEGSFKFFKHPFTTLCGELRKYPLCSKFLVLTSRKWSYKLGSLFLGCFRQKLMKKKSHICKVEMTNTSSKFQSNLRLSSEDIITFWQHVLHLIHVANLASMNQHISQNND